MKPLCSLKVLDMTDGNPYTGSMFADYGAEVLKIEKPDGGDSVRRRGAADAGEGIYLAFYNRGKKSMTLDINKEAGQEIIRRLIPQFDMVIVNKKEEDMKALGLGFESLKEKTPKLIYGVLTPYGESGPWKDMPDYDLLINSRSGLQEKTGFPAKPTKFGFPLGYIYAGWHLSAGMMAAYLSMQKTGEGIKVSVSVWHTLMSLDDTFAEGLLGMNALPKRIGNGFPTTNPTDTFQCKDGWFSLSIGSDAQWISFAQCAGRRDWAEDPRYAHDPARSMENYFGDLDQQLKDYFATITIQEADMICREAMVPGGPCNTVMELVHDEQVADREMLLHIQDKKLGNTLQIGKAAKFSWDGKEDHVIASAPLLGEDTDTYLAGINIEQVEIARLRADGVI
ncbi:MAG: CoA transferase [Hungatella sp.]|jgi:crotonobetainyl-CoA:carnitine CoA-transferase CaiB-like acyl-CoA transferase|nr:CoA transferase [Hungatella sp.]